mmetsp:Transcript_105112/g.327686  ORF Transcript_105112/g.327686 Transcript_105112/m.327686 type:complete len:482 (-) Transcript_105112:189-1634(-)
MDGPRRALCAGAVGGTLEAGFLVQAGRCSVDGQCVASPDELGSGDTMLDGAGCVIVALHPGALKVRQFEAASSSDVLTVRGKPYHGGGSGLDGLAVHGGDVLAWTTGGFLGGLGGSRWRICLQRDRHVYKEPAASPTGSQGRLMAEEKKAEVRLHREEIKLQGDLFTDALTIAALTAVMLAPLLALLGLGAAVVLRRLGLRAPWGGEKAALRAPLLATEGLCGPVAEVAARSPSGQPAGGNDLEPRVDVIDYSRSDGSRAKCVRVEAPGYHLVTGCRTIRGSVRELSGTGVHLKLVKEPDLPADVNAVESGCMRDAVGVWEHTLSFKDGPWKVEDPGILAGHSFDQHGVWQVHLVESLPCRSFTVCPHVDMAAGSDGGLGAAGDDSCSQVTSVGEAAEEVSCAYLDPHLESGNSSGCLVKGDIDVLSHRSETQSEEHSLRESADEAALGAGPPPPGTSASSSEPTSSRTNGWHLVAGSDHD